MVDVIVQNGQDQMHPSVALSQGNGKLDIVNGTGILTAVDTRIFSGVTSAQILGIENLKLTGGDGAEALIGNQGPNTLAVVRAITASGAALTMTRCMPEPGAMSSRAVRGRMSSSLPRPAMPGWGPGAT